MAKDVYGVHTSLLADLQVVLQVRRARRDWMILLCPTSDAALTTSRILAGLLPANQSIKFAGRTIKFPEGNLSVAMVSDAVFAEDFSIIFLEWVEAVNSKDLDRWKAKAKEIIRLKAAT